MQKFLLSEKYLTEYSKYCFLDAVNYPCFDKIRLFQKYRQIDGVF